MRSASVFPSSYGDGTLAKIGRNTFSSWEQTGHLAEAERAHEGTHASHLPARRCRLRAAAGPSRGSARPGPVRDARGPGCSTSPTSHLLDLAASASQHGMLEFRHAGGVVEVGFRRAAASVRRRWAGPSAVSYVDELLDAYRKFVALPVAAEPGAATAGVDGGLPAGARAPPSPPSAGVQGGHERAPSPMGADRHHHVVRDAGWQATSTATPTSRIPTCWRRRSRRSSTTSSATCVPSSAATPQPDGVVALLGAGTLFGLGDAVKVSALINAVNDAIAGRLLVFFPGEHREQQLPAAGRQRRLELHGHCDHSQTGAVDDDHQPGAVLPRSDRDEDPERRRRQGRAARDRPAVGRAALGAAQLRLRRPVRPRPRTDPRQLPRRTSARPSSRRCG